MLVQVDMCWSGGGFNALGMGDVCEGCELLFLTVDLFSLELARGWLTRRRGR